MPLVESPMSQKSHPAGTESSSPRLLWWSAGALLLVLILSVAYLLIQAAVLDDRSSYPSSVDLPQFHQVEPYLFRGGAPSDNGLKRLKDMGVKTIIDFRVNPGMSLHEQLV